VNFFNEDSIVRYVKEICLFLIWGSSLVIAVTTAARQIPAEKENRTLFPLLAKPVTRGQVLLGKFLGCWLATGMCLALFYVFFGLVAGLREHSWPVLAYAQAMLLHWFMLGIVVALSLLGSLIFAAPSSNNTITLVVVTGLLLLGRHLNKVALQMDEPLQSVLYTIYFLVPHFEFFDVRDLVIHNWGTIPWDAWWLALLYAGFYTTLFLTLGWLRFRHRAVN
jgi:ABC-type transport system involved in multi-copper enzyme maturation permease subunit